MLLFPPRATTRHCRPSLIPTLLFLQHPVEEHRLWDKRPNPALEQVAWPLTLSVFIRMVEKAVITDLMVWGLKQIFK